MHLEKIFKDMKLDRFIQFESLTLHQEDGGGMLSFLIMFDGKEIGIIEYWINSNGVCEITGMEIDDVSQRGKGYGSQALKLFGDIIDKDIYADCVSQESFFTFVKAFGRPSNFGNVFKHFKTYKEVKDYLPVKAPYDSDGHMVGSSDSAVSVYFDR